MLLIVFAASACAKSQGIDVTASIDVPKPNQTVPKPDQLDLEDVTWVVVQNADGDRFFALSPEDFLRYERNQLRVIRYVRAADAQLDFYIAEGAR